MFCLEGRLWKQNRIYDTAIYEEAGSDTRTHKVFRGLEEICHRLDLENPIWLDSNIRSFQKHARTRFGPDSFIEKIDFDFLEIRILEEDY
ncbi:MAG: hypothetical protein IKE58_04715 [Blautia sp.]|nr:hypothetical protein [Blautia sp.]